MGAHSRSVLSAGALWLVLVALAAPPATAQDVAEKTDSKISVEALQKKAARIAASYTKLERLLLRMAEIEGLTNPQRAALLKRAIQQSSERRTRKQLDETTVLLTPPAKLKQAIDQQEAALVDMKSLLELLLSENRADRLKAEENRIREYIKEVERLIRLQRSAEGRTRGGADAKRMADEQDRIAKRTGGLADKIRENEEGGDSGESKEGDPSGKSQEGEGKSGSKSGEKGDEKEAQPDKSGDDDKSKGDDAGKDSGQKDDKSGENESKSGEQGEGKSGSGQPQEGKQGKSQQGQPSPGQPSPGQSGGQGQQGGSGSQQNQQPPQQQQENPARKQLQAAEERMREAQRKLEEAERDGAVDEQEQARAALEKAKAELEEILRQLREEEIGRTLAMLEGRFRRMLEKQVEIYESTKQLDKVAADDRSRQVDIKANKLGFEETKLAVEADKALLLLHEEGSSVAFPETVALMRDDMQQVADRLSSTKTGTITQGLEEEIIAALEEMIEALQKAQKDLEEQQQQQQQQQQGRPGEQPLVDKIAELKMIRALQMRINKRTTRYSKLLEDVDDPVGQADDEDLRQSLINLARRQQRIHEVTRDIVLGKNR